MFCSRARNRLSLWRPGHTKARTAIVVLGAESIVHCVCAVHQSVCTLDVFNEQKGFWVTSLALLIHLVPTFLVLLLLAVSWRREWIGGILFLLGVSYVVWAWNKPFGVWSTLLLIAGPLVLTGSLFLLNWRYRDELRGKS